MICLGANLRIDQNDPAETIRKAMTDVAGALMGQARTGRLYRTPAYPAGHGPDYVNAAMAVRTGLDGPDVLAALHGIENAAARKRDTRWAARTLDLDLIALDALILPDMETWRIWRDLSLSDQMTMAPARLILPHPRMQDRAFVLVPLADVAPEWRHPVSGLTVAAMRDACAPADLAAVQALD